MGKLFSNISSSISDGIAKAKQAGEGLGERIGEHISPDNAKDLIARTASAITENKDKFSAYFSESGLADKLIDYGKIVGSKVAYPVILLYSALLSPTTASKDKLLITSYLGYFILPMDLIPDFIAGVGFADDAAAITACLTALRHLLSPAVCEDANKRICKIFGEVDTEAMSKITDNDKDK